MTINTKYFSNQIKYLKENFEIVPLEELSNIFKEGHKINEDKVALTFDDGFKDNYSDAYPILKKFNAPATIFVATSFVDEEYGLSEDEIRIMRKNNIAFGAHTVNHVLLSELDEKSIHYEILQSKLLLEKILDEKVEFFAYPFGKKGRDFQDEAVNIVKEAGFSAAFVTDNGFIDELSDPYLLKRLGIRNFPLFVLKTRISGIFENKCIGLVKRLLRF